MKSMPRNLSIIISLLFILLLFHYPANAQIYFTKNGYAEFSSQSTLEDFTGKSEYLTGKINLKDSTVDFYIDLSTLNTGIKLRDEHMYEDYLEVDKYPFASLYGKLTGITDSSGSDTQKVAVNGNFKVHGISHKIQINGNLLKENDRLIVKASWPLQLQDYKIDIPRFLFLRVNRTIHISIQAELKVQPD